MAQQWLFVVVRKYRHHRPSYWIVPTEYLTADAEMLMDSKDSSSKDVLANLYKTLSPVACGIRDNCSASKPCPSPTNVHPFAQPA
jgi:hypothetical protein